MSRHHARKSKGARASATGSHANNGYTLRPGVKFDESKHPRDAQGHWATTTGGVRRIKEGTHEQRAALAKEIRAARAKAKGGAKHSKLALRVRQIRAHRRGQGKPEEKFRGQGRADFYKRLPVDKARRVYADNQEREVARAVGGTRLRDYEARDVDVKGRRGEKDHAIEVKSMIFGAKKNISVHANALVRKVDESHERTFHTVLLDRRGAAEGGAHAANYSGHDIYYKRACGPYAISTMYKVKNMKELNKLIHMKDEELPAAARGAFPSGPKLQALRVKAKDEQEYNNERSKQRKAKLGRAAYGKAQPTMAAVSPG